MAWTYVISPEPDLMALIPENQRGGFIQELTETVIDRYYDERGCAARYSYVVHEAQTQDGRPHTHTHVILPGTAQDYLEGWQPFKNYRNKGHLSLLDDIATEEFTLALNQTVGLDWKHPRDLLVTLPKF